MKRTAPATLFSVTSPNAIVNKKTRFFFVAITRDGFNGRDDFDGAQEAPRRPNSGENGRRG